MRSTHARWTEAPDTVPAKPLGSGPFRPTRQRGAGDFAGMRSGWLSRQACLDLTASTCRDNVTNHAATVPRCDYMPGTQPSAEPSY